MSTIPPRTANSPRAVTISTRVYASSTSRTSRPSKSWVSPTRSVTGSSRPRPGAIGWIRLRAAATTSRGAVAGSARLRKIDNRRPTVSGRGDSRSCGSVSQLGNTATASRPSRSATAPPRSSASRSVAVTASTVRPPSARAVPDAPWPPARAAARNGRSADGPSTASAGTPVARRSRDAAVRAPSSGSEVCEQTGKLGHGSPCSHQRTAEQTPTRDGRGPTSRLRAPIPPRVGTFAAASRHVRRRESAVGHGSGRHRTETRGAGGGNTGVLHCPRLTNR